MAVENAKMKLNQLTAVTTVQYEHASTDVGDCEAVLHPERHYLLHFPFPSQGTSSINASRLACQRDKSYRTQHKCQVGRPSSQCLSQGVSGFVEVEIAEVKLNKLIKNSCDTLRYEHGSTDTGICRTS